MEDGVDYPKECPDPKGIMLEIHTRLLQLCIKHGVVLDRWAHCISCYLEKDPGSPKMDRLRIIHIFEADLNFLFKLFWSKRMVRRAEHEGSLSNDQFGSRPFKSAIDVAWKKAMTY